MLVFSKYKLIKEQNWNVTRCYISGLEGHFWAQKQQTKNELYNKTKEKCAILNFKNKQKTSSKWQHFHFNNKQKKGWH